ncbi:FAD-dependent oxidoreductase [Microbacterium aurugineum]|uniref:FAD-dependent oxidoreductase n=1 Tax=Microbacterium aurugineum TaxID=2851642 RepID=UPI0020BF8D7F|nr:FAD-dependent oxidoreductase [Microbacterium aurugineum]MCK8478918.1 FAD-dependent oxidoreductase [Microbacterium aurugineum]
MRAVIIGAGIAGLSTALRLHQAGWETLLVERAPARRDGGYAVTFGGIGYDAAERIGILSDLQARSFETTELSYHRSDGSRLFALDRATIAATTGTRSLTILRGDLESVLYERVRDHTTIRFGTTLTSFEQDDREVRVALTDGTVETADLLIGADGLHSATRALLFGPEEDFLVDLQHKIAVSMLERRPASIAPGTTGTHSSRGRTAAVISAGDGRNVAFFGYRADHARPGADVHTELRRIYGDLGWIIPEVLTGLQEADSVYFDTVSQVVVPSWSKGRVALLGDSAWCVTLFAGYGSSLAVGGADRLVTELTARPDDIPAALQAWETAIRPEAERKQRLGRRVKGIYAPAHPLTLWLSMLPLRLASFPLVRSYMTRRYIKG